MDYFFSLGPRLSRGDLGQLFRANTLFGGSSYVGSVETTPSFCTIQRKKMGIFCVGQKWLMGLEIGKKVQI
jgi:hypothetical protein